MPRGRGNNARFHSGPPRGRGRGRGRGLRGTFHSGAGELGGFGGEEGTVVFDGHFEDFNLDHVMPPRPRRGQSPARGRGGYQTPPRAFQPRGGRGARTMRGLGFIPRYDAGTPQRSYVSLSVLERDRPLLRPVKFVRGEFQKTLFQEVEEILHAPGKEDGAIENHAPSADVVARIFKTNDIVEAARVSTDTRKENTSSEGDASDESIVSPTDSSEKPAIAATVAIEETAQTFIVDTTPSPIVLNSQSRSVTIDPSVAGSIPLGESVVDEEVIVYVAPHPRTGRSPSAVPRPPIPAPKPLHPFPESSILLSQPAVSDTQPATSATPIDNVSLTLPPLTSGHQNRALTAHARTKYGLKSTPRSRKIAKKERAAARRRAEREAIFDSTGLGLGANELTALAHEAFAKVDPREAERRRGDSDIDWGTDDESGVEEVRSVFEGMELDPDLPDIAQFAQFARGVQGLGAGEVVTIADLEDTARMEKEDEKQATDDSSDQDDGVFDTEERREIGESSDSDSSGYSDGESPRGSFQARLDKIRKKDKGKAAVDAETSENDSEDGVFGPDFSWADRDEAFLEEIQDMVDEHDDTAHGQDRKARNKLFKAIQSGEFTYDDLNMRKKDRIIPLHLQAQWDRDRAKKAERKRQRALARIESTAEYSMRKSLGKKKMEKIFGSARIGGDTLVAHPTSDMAALEQKIRAFLHAVELEEMVLPPKNKEWRKRAHLLADAFNLKSKSKGKGEGRFTTLIKTTRSGVGVNERKIARLVNGNKRDGFQTPPRSIRNRDGDEVGKMAPKLSETNIGFKLLQQMGWEEGDRIGGVTGGLVNPLTAIIKTTKLGLGASRERL